MTLVAIVGGGIGGLALARALVAKGIGCVVLEAEREVGGVIRSFTVDGRVLDTGPQRTRLTPPIAALVEELGLKEDLLLAPRDLDLFIWRAGRLRPVPFSLGALLRSDVVGTGSKLRLLMEPFTSGARSSERVDAFFRRKLGDELYRGLVGPLFGGLYGSDPASMEVGPTLGPVLRRLGVGRSLLIPLLRRGGGMAASVPCSFLQGMQTLPRAMARSLGAAVKTERPVIGLSRRSDTWRVETDGEVIDAEHVVLTVPADRAAALLSSVDPETAAALGRLHYNPLAVVHLLADTPLEGLGFQVALGERRMLRGVTFNDSCFGRDGVYTAWLGEVTGLDDEQLSRAAEREFETCTGFPARTLAVARTRMPAWDLTWRHLDTVEPPPGLHFHTNWMGRPGIPGRLASSSLLAEQLATGAVQAHS